jgi:hypothetical protein
MKRVLSISTFSLVFFLATGIASAWVFFGFGFFFPGVYRPSSDRTTPSGLLPVSLRLLQSRVLLRLSGVGAGLLE